MTREEAIKRLFDVSSDLGLVETIEARIVIDEIFDEIDSRICKNCKWHKYNQKTKSFECQNPDILNFVVINIRNSFEFDEKLGFEPNPYNEDCENFGCNRFKRRENEGD